MAPENDPARTAAHAVSSQPNPEPHTTAQGDAGGVGSSSHDRFDSLYDVDREAFVLPDRILFFWTAFWLIVGAVIGRLA